MNKRCLALLSALALVGCDPCGGVVAHIESLGSGETYVVPLGCVITSPVTVPSGARVEGGVFELDGASVTLTPSPAGAPVTTLDGATVRGGNVSEPLLVARGEGNVAILASTFTIERGIAIGISGASAELAEVSVEGNLDPALGAEVPSPIDPSTLATFGVAAIDGATILASDMSIRRVAAAGLVCSQSSLAIDGATIDECVGLGIWADECAGTLDAVEIHSLVSAPLRPGIGIASRASILTADALYVHDVPGYALIAAAGETMLTGPRVERVRQSGVWVERGARLTISAGTFDENRGAAIAGAGAALVDVRATMIANTALGLIPTADGTSLDRIGDGLHITQLLGEDTQVILTDATLIENARVGVVLDGDMRELSLGLTNVRVETSGTELGVIAQNVTALPTDWDASVTRLGSAATLDASAAGLLVSPGGLAGILMPPTIVF